MEKIKQKAKILTKDEYFGGSAINSSSVKKLIDLVKKIKPIEIKDKILLNKEFELIEDFIDNNEKKTYSSLKNLSVGSAIHDICLEKVDRFEAIKNNCIGYDDVNSLKIIDLCCTRFADLNFEYSNPVAEYCFFKNFETIELKAKIDLVCEVDNKICIVDLKTISSSDAINFNINRYNYWFQCLYYKYLIEEEGIAIDDLILIFLSKKDDDDKPFKIIKFSDIPCEFQYQETTSFFYYLRLFSEMRSFYIQKGCQSEILKKILHI